MKGEHRLSPGGLPRLIGVNRQRDNHGMDRVLRALCLALALAVLETPRDGFAQSRANGVLLVAKPGLRDPNFSETVVLVTQTEDASTVGVILNRPTRVALASLLPGIDGVANYRDAVHFGGPVMTGAVVALLRSPEPPQAPAFHVLRDIYLTMHPDNIVALLRDSSRQYRLYAGFSGWRPLQLHGEMQRDGWYVVPADPETIFRRDMSGLWRELVRRAELRPTGAPRPSPRHQRKAPPQAGLKPGTTG